MLFAPESETPLHMIYKIRQDYQDFCARLRRSADAAMDRRWIRVEVRRDTDAEREWAYDRESQIGKLDKALDEATSRKWVGVDMKQDWKVIYPLQN